MTSIHPDEDPMNVSQVVLPDVPRYVEPNVVTDHILNTLQYCLETFEQACQCGQCDPCTLGQRDVLKAIDIRSLELEALRVRRTLTATSRTGQDKRARRRSNVLARLAR